MASINITSDTSIGDPFDGSDYSYLKEPFFKVSVYQPKTKEEIELPPQLLRLISKIDIQEVYDVGNYHPITITVTFVEGSREPFSTQITNTDDINTLYSLGEDNEGSLSNRIGALVDLQFLGNSSNISSYSSFQSKSELNNSLSTNITADGEVINSKDSVEYVSKSTIDKSKNTYIFREGNILKVTWGYLNKSRRTVAGIMTIIQADFPESAQPSLTIISQPLTTVFDQITPIKGTKFAEEIVQGIKSNGQPLTVFEDKDTKDIVTYIAEQMGMDSFISDNLLASKMDKNHAKVWIAGQSLHDFLTNLAKRSHAYYTTMFHPDTNKSILVFLSKTDMEKQLTLQNKGKTLFAYRQPGSILKSISLRVDYGGITGTSFTGTNIAGKHSNYIAEHGGATQIIFPGQKQIENNAKTDNSSVTLQIAEASQTIGTVNLNPEIDHPKAIKERAEATANSMSHIVALEFTTIGYPLIKAGSSIEVSGIGNRYSSIYKIQNVTHHISADGYTCNGTLRSALSAEHGQAPTKDKPGIVDLIEVQIAEPANNPVDKYKKLQ